MAKETNKGDVKSMHAKVIEHIKVAKVKVDLN